MNTESDSNTPDAGCAAVHAALSSASLAPACRRLAIAAQLVPAFVLLLVTTGFAAAPPSPARPIVVGSEEDYPPFAIGRSDETAGGFTVELWKSVAALDARAGFSQKFSFAVRKGNAELLAQINEGLALAKSAGNRWGRVES